MLGYPDWPGSHAVALWPPGFPVTVEVAGTSWVFSHDALKQQCPSKGEERAARAGRRTGSPTQVVAHSAGSLSHSYLNALQPSWHGLGPAKP